MSLTEKQKRFLRKRTHALKPIVIVGNAGLTENVITEIDNALAHHELIKVRINADDKENRNKLIEEIAQSTDANTVQTVGHIAVFYRPAEKPVIVLPTS